MNFVCGIDGGGTSTKVLVGWEDGRRLEKRFVPFNINSIGVQGLEVLLREIMDFLNTQGTCCGLCVGAAGISYECVGRFLKEEMKRAKIER